MKKIVIFGSVIVLFCFFIWGYFYFNLELFIIVENVVNLIKVVDVFEENDIFVFILCKLDVDMSVILYLGVFVDVLSYVFFVNKLVLSGYKMYIVEMFFNLVVFGKNWVVDIIDEVLDEKFVIGGYLFGGVMFFRFVYDNESEIEGVFFLVSYLDKKGFLKNVFFLVFFVIVIKDEVLN